MACGCYPLAPSKYVISNRNAAEGSPSGHWFFSCAKAIVQVRRYLAVIEADGAAWHDHRLAREDDAIRQALLEAHGERVVRVTWDQAVRHRTQTLARLTAVGRS